MVTKTTARYFTLYHHHIGANHAGVVIHCMMAKACSYMRFDSSWCPLFVMCVCLLAKCSCMVGDVLCYGLCLCCFWTSAGSDTLGWRALSCSCTSVASFWAHLCSSFVCNLIAGDVHQLFPRALVMIIMTLHKYSQVACVSHLAVQTPQPQTQGHAEASCSASAAASWLQNYT